MKRKHLTETPVCPQERLFIISNTTGLSFALKRIGPLAAIIITVFYLLVLYLSTLSNTPENPFASIYSDSLIKTACQHLLLLVGFDTLIYRKYYDKPPTLVDHQDPVATSLDVVDEGDVNLSSLEPLQPTQPPKMIPTMGEKDAACRHHSSRETQI
jgi:hypothetical protein